MGAQLVTCSSIGVYIHALTRGKHYDVVELKDDKYRIVGDHGKRVWISKSHFELGEVYVLQMQDWKFDDDITNWNIVEVPAASIARCTEHHLKKMFYYLAGIPLLEYIRRRRLTLAGQELANGKSKVIDVALRYGYESPDSFAKAFYQLHGLNPSEARKPGATLQAFPRMTFQLTVQGGEPLRYRLEDKGAFTLAGIKRRIPIVYEGENPAMTEMLGQITDSVLRKMKSLANVEPFGGYSASYHFTERELEDRGQVDHLIGVATTHTDCLELDTCHVPASVWAIFDAASMPADIQRLWARIYAEWLPTSNYQVVEGPEILYTADHRNQYHSEIWIPVKRG